MIFVVLHYLNAMVDKVIACWRLDTTVVRSAIGIKEDILRLK